MTQGAPRARPQAATSCFSKIRTAPRWDQAQIADGLAGGCRLSDAGPAGTYAVQAAIAALHMRATSFAETDWPQIAGLYEVLLRLYPTPVIGSITRSPWPWWTGPSARSI